MASILLWELFILPMFVLSVMVKRRDSNSYPIAKKTVGSAAACAVFSYELGGGAHYV